MVTRVSRGLEHLQKTSEGPAETKTKQPAAHRRETTTEDLGATQPLKEEDKAEQTKEGLPEEPKGKRKL